MNLRQDLHLARLLSPVIEGTENHLANDNVVPHKYTYDEQLSLTKRDVRYRISHSIV